LGGCPGGRFGARSVYGRLFGSRGDGSRPRPCQTDLTAVKQVVRECVAQVRREAAQRENYDQFGQPPMWRNFDAYLSPDGRVHNNANFVGEQDGVYRFEKCLAEHGFSVGFGASNTPPKPPDTSSQEELDYHPGDCWIKLSVWEKRLAFTGSSTAGFIVMGLQNVSNMTGLVARTSISSLIRREQGDPTPGSTVQCSREPYDLVE
jgi:hypothetical protein